MASEAPLDLAGVASRFPARQIALVHGEQRVSWGELDHRSRRWASALVAVGVGSDDLVAFALPNGPEFLAVAFGIYRAGATPAPLSPKLTEPEMRAILALMRPAAVIGDHPAIAASVEIAPAPLADLPGHVAAAWKACTSGGSTGRPKVIVDARPAAFPPDLAFIRLPQAAPVLIPGPLYHNATFSAAVLALSRGCTVVTMPRFDAGDVLELIGREQVEWALMVPTMLQRILREHRDVDAPSLPRWRSVVHTAAPMPPAAKRSWIDRFGADHIWEAYGATEGLVRTLIGGNEWLQRPGSVGRPTDGARVRILDAGGDDVPPGVTGEIFAMPPGGPRSTYRYIGAERRATADGWESVGDFGHVDAEGYLYLADRRTDLIISGGVNVWPAEVEAALVEHPAVLSCAVVGVPHGDLGQQVHAVIESCDPALDLDALRRFLTHRLSAQKIPRSLTLVDAPVRDDAGKIRKATLIDDYRRTH